MSTTGNPIVDFATDLWGSVSGAAQQVYVEASDVLNIRKQLMNARQALNSAEEMMRQDPNYARQWGPKITQAEAQFTDAASKYTAIQTFLNMPSIPGLQGLGQIATIAVPAALWIALAAAVSVLMATYIGPIIDGYNAASAAKLQATQNQAAIQAKINDLQNQEVTARSSGDLQGADNLQKQIQGLQQMYGQAAAPTASSQSFTDFLSSNWKTMALVAAGIVAVPYLLKE